MERQDVVVGGARLLRAPRLLYHLDRLGRGQVRSWRDIVDWLDRRRPDVVGFDVYDTVLTRSLNDPRAFETVLANLLVAADAWTGSASEYRDARAAAARRVPGEDLVAWYRHDELASRADATACIDLELETEREITVAVPGAAAALREIRSRGIEIAFVSDMYLPPACIAGLLRREDLLVGDEQLHVSGAVGRWKGDGRLFDHWLEAHGTTADRVAFVGNHPFVDWAVPLARGIAARGRRNANPNRYERRLTASGTAGATVAAAATRARLDLDPDSTDVATTVGASVIGPALMGFLLAARTRCEAQGIDQVVFVARDGDLPLQMAEAMPKDHWSGAGIDLHYLHGNRISWNLAGAQTIGVDEWIRLGTLDRYGYLNHGRSTWPARTLLQRAGLTPDDVAHLLPEPIVDPDRPLPSVDSSWPRILADRSVRELIATRARDRFDLVAGYLAGFRLRPGPCLVIDVGWRGQTAAVVSGLFEHVLGVAPLNYHFGGAGVKASVDAMCRIERYAFDDSHEPIPFHGIDQCVEMFTGDGQPRAIGYEREGAGVEPVFDSGVAAMASADRDRIWEAAVRLAELMPSADRLASWTPNPVPDRQAVTDVLRSFWQCPTPAEGLLGTRLNLEVDDRGLLVTPMSAPYRLDELRRRSSRRWPQGSAVCSAAPIRLAHPALRFVTGRCR